MSKLLELSGTDLTKARKSWLNIQTERRYHKEDFSYSLLSNLLVLETSAKSHINEEYDQKDASDSLGELFQNAFMFLHDPESLNEYLVQFYQANPRFVEFAVDILEPMGTTLMQTLKQWLGKGRLDTDLQGIWARIFIYLANTMLTVDSENESSEAGSTFSKVEQEYHDYDDIKPLNIQGSEPEIKQLPVEDVSEPEPEVQEQIELNQEADIESNYSEKSEPELQNVVVHEPKQNSLLTTAKSIPILLNSNEKYRGFRRNNSSEAEPLSVKVPTSQKVYGLSRIVETQPVNEGVSSGRFDIRKTRKSSPPPTEEITVPERLRNREAPKEVEQPSSPRSHKRTNGVANVSTREPVKKFENKSSRVVVDTSEDDFDSDKSKGFGFDPRRKSKKENNSYSFPSRTPSPEVEAEVEKPTVRTKPSIFDPSSFGLKGLDPILESSSDDDNDNDNVSSKYGSDHESGSVNDSMTKSENDEVSSGVSSLSLHNDRRSSTSGNTDGESRNASPWFGAGKFQVTQQTPAQTVPRSTNSVQQKQHAPYEPSQNNYFSPARSSDSLQASRLRSLSRSSLTSTTLTLSQKASMGFMRTSFVLKKEMETHGANLPENVTMRKTNRPIQRPPSMPVIRSERSHRLSTSASMSFKDNISIASDRFSTQKSYIQSPSIMSDVNSIRYVSYIDGDNASVQESHSSTKSRFSIFSSLFSRKSSSSSKKSAPKILNPSNFSLVASGNPSMSGRNFQDNSDIASISTNMSHKSLLKGFSFVRSKSQQPETPLGVSTNGKKSKYNSFSKSKYGVISGKMKN